MRASQLATQLPAMAHLPVQKRIEIVLTFERFKCVLSTSRKCEVSPDAVRRWVQRFRSEGNVNTKSREGHASKVTPEAAKEALRLIREDENLSPEDVAKQLCEGHLCSSTVHKTTIIRNVRKAAADVGLKVWASSSAPSKALTPQTMAKRLAFAKANLSRVWDNVMFTDRVKLHLRFPGSRVKRSVWQVKKRRGGARKAVFQPNHPMCLNVYGGITKWGTTVFHIVAGTTRHKSAYQTRHGKQSRNITGSEYIDVLQHTLLPQARALFAKRGITTFYVMQDNDPAHSKGHGIVKGWGKAHGCNVEVLPNWPPNSPDLNPIENIWGWLKGEINKKGCTTFDEFEAEARQLFAHVPKAMLTNAYNHMKARMKQVIQNKGNKTSH